MRHDQLLNVSDNPTKFERIRRMVTEEMRLQISDVGTDGDHYHVPPSHCGGGTSTINVSFELKCQTFRTVCFQCGKLHVDAMRICMLLSLTLEKFSGIHLLVYC